MATLNSKKFTTLVGDFAVAVQGAYRALIDLTIGSILRAAAEATAGVGLWLQGLAYQILAVTRLATSSGVDVDSFIADFGLTRIPAVAATGLVTFSRATPTLQAVVPIGAVLATGDGSQKFTVYVDATNTNYSATLGGYVLQANVGSIQAPVQANTPGAAGNVVALALTSLQTSVAGVDSVTNVAAFVNGVDAESDAAVKARFVAFIRSLREADVPAIQYAISTVQQGLKYSILEDQNPDLSARMGYFSVFVDDGSGAPPQALLNSVYAAVDPRRPICTSFGVFPPMLVTASVSLTITVSATSVKANIIPIVAAAIANYVSSLTFGQTLSAERLAEVAFDASPAVIDTTPAQVNGVVSGDLAVDARQLIRPGVVTVN